MWNYDGMSKVESCVNIPEVERVKTSGMVREHDNMNPQRS